MITDIKIKNIENRNQKDIAFSEQQRSIEHVFLYNRQIIVVQSIFTFLN